MSNFLNAEHFPGNDRQALQDDLDRILEKDYRGSFFTLLAGYKRVLGDNARKDEWEQVNEKLMCLFKCGKSVPLDGPMIGVSMSIRDSDYLREAARLFGDNRSALAMSSGWPACGTRPLAEAGYGWAKPSNRSQRKP